MYYKLKREADCFPFFLIPDKENIVFNIVFLIKHSYDVSKLFIKVTYYKRKVIFHKK